MSNQFYKELGVSKTAKTAEIKKAYRKQARKWHPDINPGNKEAEEKFKKVSSAYECLKDEKKRKLYDEFGEDGIKTGFNADATRQYKQWQSSKDKQANYSSDNFGRYQSYEDIFGDAFGFSAGARCTGPKRAVTGNDLEYEMTIDFLSSLKGFKTDISLEKIVPCSECKETGFDPKSKTTICLKCGGSGQVNVSQGPMDFMTRCTACNGKGVTGKVCKKCRGTGEIKVVEKIKVAIPAGVKEGSKIRVAGKGGQGQNGGRNGNLYIIIHVKSHPLLTRNGSNLTIELPVTLYEIMAGGTVTVPTIDGKIKLKIPAESQNGQLLKLKGKGTINLKTKQKGDMFVKLKVVLPKTSDDKKLEEIKKLESLYKKDIRSAIKLS